MGDDSTARTLWRVTITMVMVAGFAACATTPAATAPDPSYKLLTQPGTRAPVDDLERAILTQLAKLSPDQRTTIAGHVVVAGPPYSAASGRTCRSITVQTTTATDSHAHLACVIGEHWSFVPSVVRRPHQATTKANSSGASK